MKSFSAVIGKESVQRYITLVDECAQAGLARVNGEK